MNDDVKATAYTQISQWSDCSYDDLVKTRDALGDDPFADTFNRRLKGLDKVVRRLSDLEAVVNGFEFDLAYAYPLVVKQILFSYQVLLDEIRNDLITEAFGRDGLGITEWRTFNDGYFVGRDHHGCFEEVPDKLVYTEALVSYILDRRLKMNLDVRCSSYALFCHYDDFHSDLDNYCPSDLFRRAVKKRWVLVSDCFKDDLKKDVPFIDMILTDNA